MAKKTPQDPRRAEQRRAYRLRVKLREGDTLDAEEREFLRVYEASTRKPGTADLAPEPAQVDEPAAQVDEPTAAQVDEPAAAPAAATPPPFVPPDLPPPGSAPTPPRVAARETSNENKGGKGARWQDKYQAAGTGRETTVTTIADAWAGVLVAMADQLKAVGVDPFVDPLKLYGAIVLTVDDVLPSHVEIKPAHLAALGSTAIVTQRFMHRKAISELQQRTKDRAAHAQARAAAAAPEPAPAPAPAPATPAPAAPPVVPVAQVDEPAPAAPALRVVSPEADVW